MRQTWSCVFFLLLLLVLSVLLLLLFILFLSVFFFFPFWVKHETGFKILVTNDPDFCVTLSITNLKSLCEPPGRYLGWRSTARLSTTRKTFARVIRDRVGLAVEIGYADKFTHMHTCNLRIEVQGKNNEQTPHHDRTTGKREVQSRLQQSWVCWIPFKRCALCAGGACALQWNKNKR